MNMVIVDKKLRCERGVSYPDSITYKEKTEFEAQCLEFRLTKGSNDGFAVIPKEEGLRIVLLTWLPSNSPYRKNLPGRDPRGYTHVVVIDISYEELQGHEEQLAGLLNFQDYPLFIKNNLNCNLTYDIEKLFSKSRKFPDLTEKDLNLFLKLTEYLQKRQSHTIRTANIFGALRTVPALIPFEGIKHFCFMYNCRHESIEKSNQYIIVSNQIGINWSGRGPCYPSSEFVTLSNDPDFRLALRQHTELKDLTPDFYNDFTDAYAYSEGWSENFEDARKACDRLRKKHQLTSEMKNIIKKLLNEISAKEAEAKEKAEIEKKRQAEKEMVDKLLMKLQKELAQNKKQIEQLEEEIKKERIARQKEISSLNGILHRETSHPEQKIISTTPEPCTISKQGKALPQENLKVQSGSVPKSTQNNRSASEESLYIEEKEKKQSDCSCKSALSSNKSEKNRQKRQAHQTEESGNIANKKFPANFFNFLKKIFTLY